MKACIVINPRAGRNRRRPHLRREVENHVRARGLDAEVVQTSGRGDATQLACSAVLRGCDRVIAIGGDGTMNETAQGLVGTIAQLALVPCGSGNGLALHLGIPTQFERALALALDPHARALAIDTGRANGLPFFNAMGLGFDAEISQRFNQLTRRGLAAYVRTVTAALGSRRAETVRVRAADITCELQVLLLAVANSDQYGNHALIAPGARLTDGQLNLTAIPNVSLLGAVGLVARLFRGTLHRAPGVFHWTGPRFVVERAQDGLIHTDGETHFTRRVVEIEVVPASLAVVVPPTCRWSRPAAPNYADASAG